MLDGVEQSCVVNGDRRLFRDPFNKSLCPFRENSLFLMPVEQAAQHFTRSGDYRNSEIASNGKMPSRHPIVGRIASVTGILLDIIEADRTLSRERRTKYGRVARHGEFGNRFRGSPESVYNM